ncbi:MAG TPA: hypothetical protein VGL61_01940 [Kofleriaceae bacterium]|jgi:hypothetical protein
MWSAMKAAVLALVAACGNADPGPRATSRSTPAPAPKPAACQLDGHYRLQFRSNSTDGWWFRVQVAGDKATLPDGVEMLDLPAGPIALAADARACTVVLSGKSGQAGDVRVELVLDPKTNAVTGTLTRTKKIADDDSPVAIRGRRDPGPLAAPACLHPGLFELAVDRTASWQLGGNPIRGWSCTTSDEMPMAVVRIEPFGDALVVEPVDAESHKQSFDRAKITRTGECTFELVLDSESLSKLHARVTLGGDTIAGEATFAQVPLDDPQSGDARATCTAEHAKLIGRRVAD